MRLCLFLRITIPVAKFLIMTIYSHSLFPLTMKWFESDLLFNGQYRHFLIYVLFCASWCFMSLGMFTFFSDQILTLKQRVLMCCKSWAGKREFAFNGELCSTRIECQRHLLSSSWVVWLLVMPFPTSPLDLESTSEDVTCFIWLVKSLNYLELEAYHDPLSNLILEAWQKSAKCHLN